MAQLRFRWAIAVLKGRWSGPPPWADSAPPPGWAAYRAGRKLRHNGDCLLIEDLCEAIFGACKRKHRQSVRRALPYALAQHPQLKLVRYTRKDLRIIIDWRKRPAWRRRLIKNGEWNQPRETANDGRP
jgi:hypothetical protein